MNIVKDIQKLIGLIHSREEVIVFPIGAEGQQLLDFLRYTNFLGRVCCIAAPQVAGDNTAQNCIHEVPIIPFEHLMHFRETAILIVVGEERHYKNLNEELARIGFKYVVFVLGNTQEQIKNALQTMTNSGQIMMWYFQHFDKKITDMEHRIEEQNEVCRVNTKAFAEYRNAFRGKEVVIVGAGPTLKYYEPIPDAIHIGLNFAWRNEKIKFDYLFVQDGAYFKIISEDNNKVQLTEKIKKILFIGKRVAVTADVFRDCAENSLLTDKTFQYYLNWINGGQTIYQDICTHPLMNFGSVVNPALHFALFTNPEKLYLVGCDVSQLGHFYDKKKAKLPSYSINSVGLKTGYARMKMFARLYYPDTEIISINPVGLRGLFKDVYTDEYRKALEEEKQASEKLKEG